MIFIGKQGDNVIIDNLSRMCNRIVLCHHPSGYGVVSVHPHPPCAYPQYARFFYGQGINDLFLQLIFVSEVVQYKLTRNRSIIFGISNSCPDYSITAATQVNITIHSLDNPIDGSEFRTDGRWEIFRKMTDGLKISGNNVKTRPISAHIYRAIGFFVKRQHRIIAQTIFHRKVTDIASIFIKDIYTATLGSNQQMFVAGEQYSPYNRIAE
ncbi:hypothetical protein DSECCO2_625400 [anaerobic digester metagenome]